MKPVLGHDTPQTKEWLDEEGNPAALPEYKGRADQDLSLSSHRVAITPAYLPASIASLPDVEDPAILVDDAGILGRVKRPQQGPRRRFDLVTVSKPVRFRRDESGNCFVRASDVMSFTNVVELLLSDSWIGWAKLGLPFGLVWDQYQIHPSGKRVLVGDLDEPYGSIQFYTFAPVGEYGESEFFEHVNDSLGFEAVCREGDVVRTPWPEHWSSGSSGSTE